MNVVWDKATDSRRQNSAGHYKAIIEFLDKKIGSHS